MVSPSNGGEIVTIFQDWDFLELKSGSQFPEVIMTRKISDVNHVKWQIREFENFSREGDGLKIAIRIQEAVDFAISVAKSGDWSTFNGDLVAWVESQTTDCVYGRDFDIEEVMILRELLENGNVAYLETCMQYVIDSIGNHLARLKTQREIRNRLFGNGKVFMTFSEMEDCK
jgi:hypothetical protein